MVSVRPTKPVTHNFFSDFADAFSGFILFFNEISKQKIAKILEKSMIPTKSFAQRIDGKTGQAQAECDFVVHFFIFSLTKIALFLQKSIFLFEKFSHSIWRGETSQF